MYSGATIGHIIPATTTLEAALLYEIGFCRSPASIRFMLPMAPMAQPIVNAAPIQYPRSIPARTGDSSSGGGGDDDIRRSGACRCSIIARTTRSAILRKQSHNLFFRSHVALCVLLKKNTK